MGVPDFMEVSLISYKIGDPRVPKILGNWGPGFLISYENGTRGPHFGGSPFSHDTGPQRSVRIVAFKVSGLPLLSCSGKLEEIY